MKNSVLLNKYVKNADKLIMNTSPFYFIVVRSLQNDSQSPSFSLSILGNEFVWENPQSEGECR